MTTPCPSIVSDACVATLRALATATPPGAFVEVGVYKGGTAWHLAEIARQQGRVLHLFDTFNGIPEAGPEDREHKVGDFNAGGVDAVREAIPDAIFHIGMFPHTLPAERLGPLAFVHVDCDQYASIRACIQLLWPDVVRGGVMLFDDYPDTSGCRKAVDEVFGARVETTTQGKVFMRK